jgi:hypothetical protein
MSEILYTRVIIKTKTIFWRLILSVLHFIQTQPNNFDTVGQQFLSGTAHGLCYIRFFKLFPIIFMFGTYLRNFLSSTIVRNTF